jgi:hypothetical protein
MAKMKILRKLTLGPAMVVSALILAVLSLLGLINFSPPTVDNPSTESSEAATESSSPSQANPNPLVAMAMADGEVVNTDETANPQPAADPTDPPAAEPLAVVDVLIDGDQYRVGTTRLADQVQRETRTIGEITRACQEIPGDQSGVRVRITRTFQATAQAEQALVSALAEAGLSEDEIDLRRTLVQP